MGLLAHFSAIYIKRRFEQVVLSHIRHHTDINEIIDDDASVTAVNFDS